MKKNMINYLTVVISTKQKENVNLTHLKKHFSNPKTEFLIYENDGSKSLTEIYNKGLNDSTSDIVVFMHDDIVIETLNITPKIIKLFEKNESFGIIGVAGTNNLKSGIWWENTENRYGQVKHQKDGKIWLTKFSETLGDNLKKVVVLDGLFLMVHKKRIKSKFVEDFKGFHFYDLSFCMENFIQNVDIGVTTKIRLIHGSVGELNKKWMVNKTFFEAKYEKYLPIQI